MQFNATQPLKAKRVSYGLVKMNDPWNHALLVAPNATFGGITTIWQTPKPTVLDHPVVVWWLCR